MNSTALVTGASGGIGLELTRLLAADQFDLVIVARSGDKLKKLQQELTDRYKIEVTPLVKDLTDPEAPREIEQALDSKEIDIEVLVNNAGIGDYGFFHEADWGKQQAMIQLNITALTHLTYLFLPGMVERGSGQVLNVASTAAFQPGPLMSVYYATKAYVLHFTEAIAEELKGTGVTATALCPGPTATDFEKQSDMEDSALFENLSVMQPTDVAKSGYKGLQNGQVIVIPGFTNKMLIQSVRVTPRPLLRKVVRKIQEGSAE